MMEPKVPIPYWIIAALSLFLIAFGILANVWMFIAEGTGFLVILAMLNIRKGVRSEREIRERLAELLQSGVPLRSKNRQYDMGVNYGRISEFRWVLRMKKGGER